MRKKFKVGDYVYSKKQRMTSIVTSRREYGAYIKRQGGVPLCCPWDDLIAPTKEQIREYIISQNKVRAEERARKANEGEFKYKPFYGGTKEKVKHKVNPTAEQVRWIKDILRYLNNKCAQRYNNEKTTVKYPISAVWHSPGFHEEGVLVGQGLVRQKIQYGYGWTLVTDWMSLLDDSAFIAYLKGLRAKYKSRGLEFDFVFFIHNKVRYSGLLSIRPTESMKVWLLPNEQNER